jgi:hypothetical protein
MTLRTIRASLSTWFAALEVATGQVRAGRHHRRRRREFLQFMNEVLTHYSDRDVHVILANLNTHKPKHDRWPTRHPRVHFHFTPTHARWLNAVPFEWHKTLVYAKPLRRRYSDLQEG